MKISQPLLCLASLLAFTGAAHSTLIVYEGFDYPAGSLASSNGGDGWNGAWTGGNFNVLATGLSFGALEEAGGAIQRPSRSGNAATSRVLSAASTTDLTNNGSTIWFSVLMQSNLAPGNGFATNSWGTLVFGDTALTGGSGVASAPIGAGGNAIGLSFHGGNGANFSDVELQGVIYDGGTASATPNADLITVGDNVTLIVGSVTWEANGTDDTLSLYNVTDPSAALPAAFTTLTADLDQSVFDTVSIGDAQTSVFDEIRIGTELTDVLPVPEPSSIAFFGLASLALLRRRRR